MHLLIDSRQALDAVALVLDSAPQRRERSDLIERRLSSISGASANREVTVEWERGHNGHPLNDAADRIAVLVRRSAAWATGVATSADLATSIAQGAAVAFATSRRPTE
ncbi:hypothetical protein [Rathayibacter sp. Leaf296]|uniref:hypothetical protein n=1 Tax=Rathayibacter sp. Leaf296 TaxID=1736327 RepID=UPI000702B10A|nr:hypothetical protein [Rathayibacter sp. Leaf296]KQQ09755.1 hypothetical protein ASF46_01115 [Rathayibacter sp. Leaf296]